ncbi:hypothetical protein GmHk_02G005972 [Glycine max]|nr:hypothetical protein GmHk_02G005972 [Glycine max]
MLSFFAAQVEKEKVWDLERVWFWLVTEECVEAEEEGRRNRRCSTDDRISKLGSDHSFACSTIFFRLRFFGGIFLVELYGCLCCFLAAEIIYGLRAHFSWEVWKMKNHP